MMLAVALALTACAAAKPNPTPPYFSGHDGPGDPMTNRVGGEAGLSLAFGYDGSPVGPPGPGIGVNPFLWRGALEALGTAPLITADPFGGVIITDWYSRPGDAGERFKTTAFIGGSDLRGDGVSVSVFRQISQGGSWVDAPVRPGMQTEIQTKVLDRARQLATGQG
jgi:hypothetical protein